MRVILAVLFLLLVPLSSANAYWTSDVGNNHARISHHYERHFTRRESPIRTILSDARPSDCYGIPWCGCYLRHLLGIADKSFNSASRWFAWGHNSQPCAGCVAVSRHHVALIVGGSPGNWIVKQGNPLRYGHDALRWAVAFRSP